MARYADPFLNALMYSHHIVVSAELWWYDTTVLPTPEWRAVGPLDIVAGSVDGDRAGSVRRTAQITLDPSVLTSTLLAPKLNPYGSRVKIWRGIRYPNGTVAEELIFYGRIDVVDTSFGGVELRCSDLASYVVDARFLDVVPMTPLRLLGISTPTKLNCIKQLILEVHPGMQFNTTGITDATTVRSDTVWAQERGDALDSLCTQLQDGSEWYIDMAGIAHVHKLPAIISSGAEPAWIIDTGDSGVLVDRVLTTDRQGVYNGISVDGEAMGGTEEAHGIWKDDPAPPYNGNANSPTRWGYGFGKVTGYYTGQQLSPNNNATAAALARTIGLNSIASVKSVAVTCVPNPKLKLGDVVYVFTGNANLDGNYFVQSFSLPLEPETPMTMTLYSTLVVTTTGWRHATDLSLPEGATWQPTR